MVRAWWCSKEAVQQLQWHTGAMSHARFCGRGGAVTSATDGAIACWDLGPGAAAAAAAAPPPASTTSVVTRPLRIHGGHAHRRNFVGLSARPSAAGHLVASGSEDGRVAAYTTLHLHRLASWRLHSSRPLPPSPPAQQQKPQLDQQWQRQGAEQPNHQGGAGEFISSVVWAPLDCAASAAPLLALAGSDGCVNVLELQD